MVTNLGNLVCRQRTFRRPEVILERVDGIRLVDEFRSRYKKACRQLYLHQSTKKVRILEETEQLFPVFWISDDVVVG